MILLKVCRRIYHCKIQVKFDISNHPKHFGKVMALFDLVAFRDRSDYKDQCFSFFFFSFFSYQMVGALSRRHIGFSEF